MLHGMKLMPQFLHVIVELQYRAVLLKSNRELLKYKSMHELDLFAHIDREVISYKSLAVISWPSIIK